MKYRDQGTLSRLSPCTSACDVGCRLQTTPWFVLKFLSKVFCVCVLLAWLQDDADEDCCRKKMFSQSTPSGERGVVAPFSGLCRLDHLGQWAHGRMIGIFLCLFSDSFCFMI